MKSLKLPIIIYAICFYLIGVSSANSNEEQNSEDLKKLFVELMSTGKKVERQLPIGKKIILPMSMEGTTKGNGLLSLYNINIRLFDQHDDGLVYENDMLDMELKDINNDNIKEVIFSGVVKITGEKESDPVEYKAVLAVYLFDCKKGSLVILYGKNYDYIELPENKVKPIKCLE